MKSFPKLQFFPQNYKKDNFVVGVIEVYLYPNILDIKYKKKGWENKWVSDKLNCYRID